MNIKRIKKYLRHWVRYCEGLFVFQIPRQIKFILYNDRSVQIFVLVYLIHFIHIENNKEDFRESFIM